MGTISEILKEKQDRPILSIEENVTVLAATKLMNEHSIGALIVTGSGRMVGIFTERDVLRRVVAEERAPATVRVSEVMTTKVACCTPETSIDEAQNVMRQYRVRHLPVVNTEGEILNMISIGDINAHHASHQAVTIHYMNEYMLGRV